MVVCLSLMAPFFALSWFAKPSADDFSIANLVNRYGYEGYQTEMFLTWTGRYTANAAEALLSPANTLPYRIYPIIVLILLMVSVLSALRTFARNLISPAWIPVAALALCCLYLNVFPSLSEGLYWFPGALEYLSAACLTLLAVTFMARLLQQRHGHRPLYFAGALVSGIAVCGLNEISLGVMLAISITMLAYGLKIKRGALWMAALMLIFTAFSVFELMAPGNYARMSEFRDAGSMGMTLCGAASSLAKLLGLHFQNAAFVILSVLYIPFASGVFKKLKPAVRPVHFALPFLATLVVIYTLYLPGWYGMGLPPPMRVHGLCSFVFIALWLITLTNLALWISLNRSHFQNISPATFRAGIAVAILLTLTDFGKDPGKEFFFRSNIPAACYDLVFRTKNWQQQHNHRIKEIEKAKSDGISKVWVPAFVNPPRTLFFVDMSRDPQHWINRNVAGYYQLETIAIR